tara:strand:+ start:219 stop:389 length:171 start_codon:yes stop_codon:yes gene_type:complete
MKAFCLTLATVWVFISCSKKTDNQIGGKPPYYDGRDNFVEPNPHTQNSRVLHQDII